MSNISTQVVALNNNNSSSNNNNNNNKSSNIDDGNYPYENGSQAMEVHDQERVIHEEPLSEGNSKKYMVMVRNSSTPFGYNKAGGNNDNIIDEGGVKYMECLKNHAAAIGGNARDGCCEFMPSGEEGTLEALKCSACHCHRNFHRKLLQGPEVIGYPTGTLIITPKAALEQRKISYKNGIITSPTSDSDDGKEGAGFMALKRPCQQAMKKRFRTKFTLEQKEKMFNFAEKAGWKIQKLDDSVIHQFCQELGIKRRVLKVWMHNNKHNSAKKSSPTT